MPVLLVLLFLVVPILEIYVIIQVGQVIGGWQTVALLVAESLLGGWLVKREGRRAWRALRDSFSSRPPAGRPPGRELLDGALVLVGGTLLLTPGFLTDVVGFFLILPFTRPIARRLLTRLLTRRVLAAAVRPAGGYAGTRTVRGASFGGSGASPAGWPPASAHRGDGRSRVVPGQVVPGEADRPGPQ